MIRYKNVLLLLVLVSLGPAPLLHAATSVAGGALTAVTVARETTAKFTNSTAFVDLPGAAAQFTIASGQQRLVVARLTAESQCSGNVAGNWCSVRIVVVNTATGGITEMIPDSSIDGAFDSVENGGDGFWEGNAAERSIVKGAGTYIVKAQWAVTSSTANFRLDDWSFTVERFVH